MPHQSEPRHLQQRRRGLSAHLQPDDQDEHGDLAECGAGEHDVLLHRVPSHGPPDLDGRHAGQRDAYDERQRRSLDRRLGRRREWMRDQPEQPLYCLLHSREPGRRSDRQFLEHLDGHFPESADDRKPAVHGADRVGPQQPELDVHGFELPLPMERHEADMDARLGWPRPD